MGRHLQSSTINHYIITRFNIKLHDQMVNNELEKINVATDEEYLKYRFSIFEKYTIPSIESQTNKNFTWIVLFSEDTPESYKERIRDIKEKLKNFCPIMVDSSEVINSKLARKFKFERTGILVTSRLDNDDALSVDYVEAIQNNILNNGKTELLIFPDGIQYDMNRRIMTRYNFKNNHFSTLVCDEPDKFRTILGYNHMDIVNYFEVRFLFREEPMWLEIVHGGNIINRMFLSFSRLIFDFSILKKFGYQEHTVARSRVVTYMITLFNRPMNAYHIVVKYGLRKTMKKISKRLSRKGTI